MGQRIIYPDPKTGGVAVVIPAPNSPLTMNQLAERVVPSNTPFKIIDESEVPSDRTFRDAWEYSE